MVEAARPLREISTQSQPWARLNPNSLTAVGQQKDIEQAAQTVGLRVQFLKASNEPELEAAFQAIIEIRIPALLVPADAFFAASRERIAELAVQSGVLAIFSLREAAVSGGLMSYGNLWLTLTGSSGITLAGSLRAQRRLNCRSLNLQNSNSSSTSKRPRRSA